MKKIVLRHEDELETGFFIRPNPIQTTSSYELIQQNFKDLSTIIAIMDLQLKNKNVIHSKILPIKQVIDENEFEENIAPKLFAFLGVEKMH